MISILMILGGAVLQHNPGWFEWQQSLASYLIWIGVISCLIQAVVFIVAAWDS